MLHIGFDREISKKKLFTETQQPTKSSAQLFPSSRLPVPAPGSSSQSLRRRTRTLRRLRRTAPLSHRPRSGWRPGAVQRWRGSICGALRTTTRRCVFYEGMQSREWNGDNVLRMDGTRMISLLCLYKKKHSSLNMLFLKFFSPAPSLNFYILTNLIF